MRYELSRQALRQIEQIVAFTDDWFGEEQTTTYVYGLYEHFEALADFPRYGRKWSGGYYRSVYKRHSIYYRIRRAGGIEVPVIVSIVHSRNIQIPSNE